jgi:chaperone LolA
MMMTVQKACVQSAAVLALAAAAVTVGSRNAGAQAQAAERAVDRAVAAWSGVRSVTGTFEQTVTNSLTGGRATMHADFQQQRPNRLSVRYTDGRGDAIVSDGQWLWIYLPSSIPNQVVKRPASDQNNIPADPGRFLDSPRTKYQIADKGAATVGSRATRAVELTPRRQGSEPFLRATVWIDDVDGTIRQFDLVESASVTRRIQFTTIVPNGKVDPALFNFVVPKGAKVVDGK